MWYDHDFTSPEAKAFSPASLLYYYLPNSFWIICPILVMYFVSKRVVNYAMTQQKQE